MVDLDKYSILKHKSFWDSKFVLKCKSFLVESGPNHLNCALFLCLFQLKDMHATIYVHEKGHVSLISTLSMLVLIKHRQLPWQNRGLEISVS